MWILSSNKITYTPDSLRKNNSLFVNASSSIISYMWKLWIVFENNVLTVPWYEPINVADDSLGNTEIYFTRWADNSCLICGKDADGYSESMIYPFFYKNEKRISEADMIQYGLFSHQDSVHHNISEQVKWTFELEDWQKKQEEWLKSQKSK